MVDIAGYFLTDTLADKFKYLITTNGPHIVIATERIRTPLANAIKTAFVPVTHTIKIEAE